MIIFVDTSAFFALMVSNDSMHDRAKRIYDYFSTQEVPLVTSSYVILETIALLQRRISLNAVSDFQLKVQPLLDVVWVDADWHGRAMQRLLAQNDRDISLVDSLSFELMDAMDLTVAFAYDRHFEENGFRLATFEVFDHR